MAGAWSARLRQRSDRGREWPLEAPALTLARAKCSLAADHASFLQRVQPAGGSCWPRLPGKHLAWVRNAQRIKSGANAFKQRDFGLAKHLRQILALLHADPVFAGDRSSHLNAHPQYAPGERLCPLKRTC